MAHPFKAAQPPSWLRGLGSAANLRPAGIPRCAQRNAVGIVAASFELSFCAQVAGRRGPARHPGQCALRTLAGRTPKAKRGELFILPPIGYEWDEATPQLPRVALVQLVRARVV